MNPPRLPFHERHQNSLIALSTAFTACCFIGAGFIVAQDSPTARPIVRVAAPPAFVRESTPEPIYSPQPVREVPAPVVVGEIPALAVTTQSDYLTKLKSDREQTLAQIRHQSAVRKQLLSHGKPTDVFDNVLQESQEKLRQFDEAIANAH
jgi:hypothetical protein